MVPTDFTNGVALVNGETDEITCQPEFYFSQTTNLNCFKECVVYNNNPITLWNPDTACECKTILTTEKATGTGTSDTTASYISRDPSGVLTKIKAWNTSTTLYGFQLYFENGYVSPYYGYPFTGSQAQSS